MFTEIPMNRFGYDDRSEYVQSRSPPLPYTGPSRLTRLSPDSSNIPRTGYVDSTSFDWSAPSPMSPRGVTGATILAPTTAPTATTTTLLLILLLIFLTMIILIIVLCRLGELQKTADFIVGHQQTLMHASYFSQ